MASKACTPSKLEFINRSEQDEGDVPKSIVDVEESLNRRTAFER